jgi:hypothetical protein
MVEPSYFSNQTQGGFPMQAGLYLPQPEKDPPVWGSIYIKRLIVATWNRIRGKLADFILKYSH